MINRPTTAQLIDAARAELAARVAPHVSDPQARVALDMSLAVLGTASARSAYELAWMDEEVREIEALTGASAGPATGATIEDAHARYERGSELLAGTAEDAFASADAAAIGRVTELFAKRRDRQDAISGGYRAVGRSEEKS